MNGSRPILCATGLVAAVLVSRAAHAQAAAENLTTEPPGDETRPTTGPVAEADRTPPPPRRPSEGAHFAMGFVTLFAPPERTMAVAPGVDLDVHHEYAAGNMEFGGALRFGKQDNSDFTSMTFVVLSLGGKYFTSPAASWSPYLGLGLTLESLSLQLPSISFQGTQFGPGSYADAGVEFFRTDHTHVALGARLDLPFFTIGNTTYGPASAPSKFYYAPLSLEFRVTL
jgi:hypothetical protein